MKNAAWFAFMPDIEIVNHHRVTSAELHYRTEKQCYQCKGTKWLTSSSPTVHSWWVGLPLLMTAVGVFVLPHDLLVPCSVKQKNNNKWWHSLCWIFTMQMWKQDHFINATIPLVNAVNILYSWGKQQMFDTWTKHCPKKEKKNSIKRKYLCNLQYLIIPCPMYM